MKELEKYKEFYADSLVKQENIEEYKSILSAETYYILKEIGLPAKVETDMWFNEPFRLVNNTLLVIGKSTSEIPIMINLSEGETIVYNVSSTFNTLFINSSLKGFLGCIYEYENSLSMVRKFGDYNNPSNRKLYSDYLKEKLYAADKDSVDYSKGYHWGFILEAIEDGL